MSYQNKTILITGAYRGIGASIANYFGKCQANLILTYHAHPVETNKLKEELVSKYHISVDCVYLDLCQEESIVNVYNYVKDKYKNLDILINNAALSLDNDIMNKTKEEFMKVLEVNLVGTFLTTKYMLKIMKKGDIINISSLDSTKSFNNYSVDYIASKAGVNSLVKTMSLDYKDIRFISILLPFVDTSSIREMNEELLKEEMNKYNQKRLMTVSEVSNKIITIINDKTIKSGSIIEVEDF